MVYRSNKTLEGSFSTRDCSAWIIWISII